MDCNSWNYWTDNCKNEEIVGFLKFCFLAVSCKGDSRFLFVVVTLKGFPSHPIFKEILEERNCCIRAFVYE